MEALLCANSMVVIKQSHIWGIISWKIYTFIYIYTHLYMNTSTEYSQIYWPLHQQKIKLIEKESHNRKKLHRGHLQKCGYIILNIRSMFWIIALRKKCFHLYENICHRNETKKGTWIQDYEAYQIIKGCARIASTTWFYLLLFLVFIVLETAL